MSTDGTGEDITKNSVNRKGERGNVFFTLFGAVAVVGVLGAGIMATMRGPLSTMVEVNNRTQAEAQMSISSKLAMLAATNEAFSGDCEVDDGDPDETDGDGFVEPLEYDADIASLTGGGTLPANIGGTRIDPWGSEYGYCAWDPGPVNGKCNGNRPNLLDGEADSSEDYTVIAVISAGPDRIFQSTCANQPTGITRNGDDLIAEFDYRTASLETGGLWNIKSGEPGVAEIEKDLDVVGGATFSGGIDLTSSTAALQLGAASMLFPNESTLSTCNGANDGLLRINTATTPDSLEVCDDPTGFVSVAAGAEGLKLWQIDGPDGGSGEIYYMSGNVAIGSNDAAEALDVTGNIALSGNLDIAGDIQMDNTQSIVWTSTATVTESSGNVQINGNGGGVEIEAGGGLVGIGTSTAANQTLTVAGLSDTNADAGLNVTNNSGTSILYVQSDGNVGVGGETSPDDDLDVAGTVDTDTNYQIDDLVVLNTDSTMSDTVLVGNAAGSSTTGDSNTVVGGGAATALSSGTENTIIGAETGDTLQTGDRNILIGSNSGTPVDVPLATTSDHLNIGNAIYGNLSSRFVGIGHDPATVDVSAFDDSLEVSGDIDATGDIDAVNITASTTITANTFVIPGDGTFGPAPTCPDGDKLEYDDGWGCIDESGAGASGEGQNLAEVLAQGTDADGEPASNFYKVGSDEFCNADLSTCFDPVSVADGDGGKWEDAATGSDIRYTSGDVGVGVADPLHPLDVSGNVRLSGVLLNAAGAEATPSYTFSTDTNTGLYSGGADILALSTGGNEALRVLGNSDVAIGGTSVSTGVGASGQNLLVDVAGPVGATYFCDADGEDCFQAADLATAGLWTEDGSNDYIEYDDSLGGVRIGKVTGQPAPLSDWTIDSTNNLVYTSGGVVVGGTSLSSGDQDLELDVTGDIGAVNYCDEDGANCFTAAGILSGDGGKWQDGVGANEIHYSSGNVGVGTNDPEGLFNVEVADSGVTPAHPGISVENSGAIAALNVLNDTQGVIAFGDGLDADVGMITYDHTTDQLNLKIGGNDNAVQFYSDGSVEFASGIIFNDGELVFPDGTRINSSNAAGLWTKVGNDIYNENSGNVGIGITNPDDKLDVVGTMQVTGAVTLDSTLSITGDISDSDSDVTIDDGLIVTGDISDSGGSVVIADDAQITGTLDMDSGQINNLADPTLNQDAATKAYVDTEIASGEGGLWERGADNDIYYSSGTNPYVGIGTTDPLATLDITLPNADTIAIEIDDNETAGRLSFGNSTTSAGLFEPQITGRPDGNPGISFEIMSFINDDSGTEPAMLLIGRDTANNTIDTRPILQVRDFLTPVLHLDADGNLGLGENNTILSAVLDVNGNVDFEGGDIQFSSAAHSFTVAGPTTINNTLTLTGDISDSDSAVTVADDLTVTGATTLSSTLAVTDTVTFTSGINMTDDNITDLADPVNAQDAATKAYVDAEIASGAGGLWDRGTGDIIHYDSGTPLVGIGVTNPDDTLEVNGTMQVTGATTLDSTLSVTGDISDSDSAVTIADTLNVEVADSGQTPGYDGIAIENGAADVGLNLLNTGDNLGILAFGDAADADVGMITYDHSTDQLNLSIGGNADVVQFYSDGSVEFASGIQFNQGELIFPDGTRVNSSTAAGLWTDGAGDIIYYNSGTPLVAIGATTADDTLDVVGTAQVTGSVVFGSTLSVAGDISDPDSAVTIADTASITGTLNVDGDISDSDSDVTIADGLIVTGNISDSDSDVTINDGLIVVGDISDSDSDVTINDGASITGTLNVDGDISDSDSAVTVADDLTVTGATTLSSTLAVTDTVTFTSGINMTDDNITDLADPVNDQDAATKAYVDTEIASGAGGLWDRGTGDIIHYDSGTPLVGIGVTNPDDTLEVNGTMQVTGATTLDSTLSVTGNISDSDSAVTVADTLVVEVADTGVAPAFEGIAVESTSGAAAINLLNSTSGILAFGDADNDVGQIVYDHSTDQINFTIGGNANVVQFYEDGSVEFASGIIFNDGELVFPDGTRINSSNAAGIWTKVGNDIYNENTGNVGVGITNPDDKLDVDGTMQVTGAVTFDSTLGVTGATTLSSTLRVDGNISDGDSAVTIADDALVTGNLEIQGSLSNSGGPVTIDDLLVLSGGISDTDSAVTITDQLVVTSTVDFSSGLNMTNNQINFVADPTEAQDVATKAYVDSGAGTPWEEGSDDDIYYNSGTPTVGIGTTNPDDTLDVVGTMQVTGATVLGSTLSVTGDISDSDSAVTIADALVVTGVVSDSDSAVTIADTLNVEVADSGQTPDYDGIAIENGAANVGLSLLNTGDNLGILAFGDAADADIGMITYDHSTDQLNLTVGGNSTASFYSDGTVEFASGIRFNDGELIFPDGTTVNSATAAGLWTQGAGDIIHYNSGTPLVAIGATTADDTLDVVGTAQVTGSVVFGSTLQVDGDISDGDSDVTIADGLIVTGDISDSDSDVTINDGLIVVGDISDSDSAVTIADDASITGTLNVDGDVSDSDSAFTIADDAQITGTLDMDSGQINNVADPTSAQDAATKAYVDSGAGTPWTVGADNDIYYNSGAPTVGIGTTNPDDTLDVVGTMQVTGATVLGSTLQIDGDISDSDSAVTIADDASVTGALNVDGEISDSDSAVTIADTLVVEVADASIAPDYDGIAVESTSGAAAINLLNDTSGIVAFGDGDDADIGMITYDHSTDQLNLTVGGNSTASFYSDGTVEFASGIRFNDGELIFPDGTTVNSATAAGLWTQGAGDIIHYNSGTPLVAIGATTADDTLDVVGTAQVTGSVVFGSTLNVAGDISDPDSAVTIADNMAVTGQVNIDGALNVDGNISDSDSAVIVADNFNVTGTTTLDSTLSIAGAISDTDSSVIIDDNAQITGDLDMDSGQINNLANPTLAQDAATKDYVDTEIASGDGGKWQDGDAAGDIKYVSGDVGIGLDNPIRPLHVADDTTPYLRFSDTDAANETEVVSFIEWYQGENTTRVGYFGFANDGNRNISLTNETSDGDIRITAAGQNRLVVGSDGEVDIGSSSVDGGLNIANSSANNATVASPLYINNPKTTVSMFLGRSENTSAYTADESSGNIRFNGAGVSWGDFGYYPTGGDDTENGHFRFSLAGGAIDTTPDAKVGVGQLYAATNVGINNLSPNDALDVVGTAQITGAVTLDAALSVGTTLDMTSGQINNLADPSLAQDAATKAYVDTEVAGAAGLWSRGTGDIIHYNSGTPLVAIGATTADDTLDVVGTAEITGATVLGSTLQVDGDISDGDSAVTIADSASITGTLNVDGDISDSDSAVTVADDFTATGATTLSSTLSIAGAISDPDSPVTIDDLLVITGGISDSDSAVTITDGLTVTSTVDFSSGLNMTSNQINFVADPTEAQDAATKSYVDTLIASGDAGKWQDGDVAGDIKYMSGDVGIGTSNPDDALDVVGTAQITGATVLGSTLQVDGDISDSDSDVTIDDGLIVTGDISDSGGSVIIADDASVTGTLNVDGDVSDSDSAFTIADDAQITGTLDMDSGQINNLADPSLAQDAATKAYVDSEVSGASPWTIGAGDDIYYNSGDSHVGIGTTNPVQPLHIVSDVPIIRLDDTDSGTGSQHLFWIQSDDMIISADNLDTATGADIRFLTSGTERMKIEDGGDVGIGTTNPDDALDVVGTMQVTGAVVFDSTLQVDGDISDSAGSVVIADDASITGTLNVDGDVSDSDSAFTIADDAQITGVLDMDSGQINNLADPSLAQDAATKAYVDTAAADGGKWDTGTGDIIFYNSGTPLVAIGATTADDTLDVVGTAQITGATVLGSTLQVDGDISDSDSDVTIDDGLIVTGDISDSGGSVIIADDASVTGTLNVDGDVSDSDSAFTIADDASITGTLDVTDTVTFTSGINMTDDNITDLADPVNAQDAATKAYVDTQVSGVSIGIDDLSDAYRSDAKNNIFLGHEGGSVGTTDDNNVGVGDGALDALIDSDANHNTAVGVNALTANTTGDSNSAFGTTALQANISGTQNTALGAFALDAITTTNNNTAVGFNALSATTGTSNTAMGASAMSGGDGTSNTAIGVSTLAAISGNNNVALGDFALNAVTSGNNNIALGYQAADNLSSGSSNITIGSVDVVNTTGSNQLNIGNTIYGDLSSDLVGIGVTNPDDALDVDGTMQVTGAVQLDSTLAVTDTVTFTSGINMTDDNITDLADPVNAQDAATKAYVDSEVSAISLGIDGLSDGAVINSDSIFLGHEGGSAGATDNFNYAFGLGALDALNDSDGDGNIAIGRNVLSKTTSGDNNVGLGDRVLETNTTGVNNIGLGQFVLFSNTTGGSNIAIGASSLFDNTTGSTNIAIGGGLINNTTGSSNIAIGPSSLGSNITQSANAAIGSNVMSALTSGTENVSFGNFSMNNTATGSSNVVFGFNAMRAAATATNNTIIGHGAAFGTLSSTITGNTIIGKSAGAVINTGADANVMLGVSAGGAVTSGANNTLLGTNAGDNITTGDNNIVIGQSVDAVSATGDNQLNIGDTIYGDLSSDLVGIGVTNPDDTLDVDGTAQITGAVQLDSTLDVTDTVTFTSGINMTDDNITDLADPVNAQDAATKAYVDTQVSTVSIGIDDLSDAAKNDTDFNLYVGSLGGSPGGDDNNNVALGHFSLDALDNSGANNNTALGRSTLSANTSGDSNTAVGYSAMAANISGLSNTALGAFALDAITTTNSNTALGSTALSKSTSGASNTAIGATAMSESTSGSSNVAVGVSAVRFTTGSSNVGVGVNALNANVGGNFNVAVGDDAGAGAASSAVSNNVLLGASAGTVIDTGANNNVMVGSNAGVAVTTGNTNTLLGYLAADNLTTGSSNIIIGSVDAVSATGDNQLNIGDTIYGDLSSDLVGIGVTNPDDALDVDGTMQVTGAVQLGSTLAVTDTVTFTSGINMTSDNITDLADPVNAQDAATKNYVDTRELGDFTDVITDYSTLNEENMSWGDDAGDTITSGTGNLNIGAQAGTTLSTGNDNVILGHSAGKLLTNSENVFIGYDAGRLSTTADKNVYIGKDAARSATTGENNVSIGFEVNHNGNTSNSVMIGFRAGAEAGKTSDGDQNVYIGRRAGFLNDTGKENVVIGFEAGKADTSGLGNILIGNEAGATLNGGNKNIIIGYAVDVISTGDNQTLNIGNSIYGNLVGAKTDDTGTAHIGINNTAPDVALDVIGDIEHDGTITDVSDIRLKENIEPLTKHGSLLEKLEQIDTYSFTMKRDPKGRIEYGVMAQELEEIFPLLVHTAKDEMGTKSVNYLGLIAPMIEATKELKAENEMLKAELAAVKTETAKVHDAVAKLSDQVELLNKAAGNNVGKASLAPQGNNWLFLLLGLLGGACIVLVTRGRRNS